MSPSRGGILVINITRAQNILCCSVRGHFRKPIKVLIYKEFQKCPLTEEIKKKKESLILYRL
jgi:hypothetical protein